MTEKKIIPYDTGKVKIGCNYHRPVRAYYSAEERLIQRALLGRATPAWRRTDWLAYIAVVTLTLAAAMVMVGRGE